MKLINLICEEILKISIKIQKKNRVCMMVNTNWRYVLSDINKVINMHCMGWFNQQTFIYFRL